MNTRLRIGLDVHKNSIVVATARSDGSKPRRYGQWGGTDLAGRAGPA